MRCVTRCVRCLNAASKFAASALAAAAVVFVWSAPASAHEHHNSYRHHSYRHAHAHGIHYAGRHHMMMYANGLAANGFAANGFAGTGFGSSGGYAYQNNSAPYAAPSSDFGGNFSSSFSNNFSNNGYARSARYDNVSAMAASNAGAAGLPASLVERVIRRESGGNPRAVHAGNYGLMQIRLGTARAMGYTGSAAGLLDPQTNMTYALRYLAGAYRAAGGNESRAIALYSRGYYYQAKAQGFSPYASGTSAASSWGGGNYGATFQPAYRTTSWPSDQYGVRHRRHYHA